MINIKNNGKVVVFLYSIYLISGVAINTTNLAENSLFSMISKIILTGVTICLSIYIIFLSKTLKRWFLIIVLLVTALISFYFSGAANLMIFFLFLIASEGVDIDYFVRTNIVIRSTLTLLTIILNYFGITKDITMYREGAIRHSLGFGHPNTLGIYLFVIFIEYLYLRWKKLNSIDLVSTFIFAYIVNSITGSRTAVIMILVSGLMALIFKYINLYQHRILSGFFVAVPIIMSLISFMIIKYVTPGSSLFFYINKMVSGRLTNYINAMNTYGISIIGQPTPLLSQSYQQMYNLSPFYLDNSYLVLGVRYGVIVLLLFLAILTVLIIHTIKLKNYAVLLLVLAYSLYGLTEGILVRPEMSILCMMGTILFQSKIKMNRT